MSVRALRLELHAATAVTELRVRGTLDDDLYTNATFDFADLGREDRAWLGRTLERAFTAAWGGPLPEGAVVLEGRWLAASLTIGDETRTLRDTPEHSETWRTLAQLVEHVQGILRIDDGAGPGKPRPRGEMPG